MDTAAVMTCLDLFLTSDTAVAHLAGSLGVPVWMPLSTTPDWLSSDALATLTAELRSVNEALWEIEDKIRGCERSGDFGPKFVELARSVYQNNDSRAAIKRKINVLLGSRIIEEKSYA